MNGHFRFLTKNIFFCMNLLNLLWANVYLDILHVNPDYTQNRIYSGLRHKPSRAHLELRKPRTRPISIGLISTWSSFAMRLRFNQPKMRSVLRENKNSMYNILKKCCWYTASRVADAVQFLSLHISYQTYVYVGLYIYFRYCLGCSPSTDLTARLLSLSNCFFIPTPNVRDDK